MLFVLFSVLCLVDYCLSFRSFSFGHCIACFFYDLLRRSPLHFLNGFQLRSRVGWKVCGLRWGILLKPNEDNKNHFNFCRSPSVLKVCPLLPLSGLVLKLTHLTFWSSPKTCSLPLTIQTTPNTCPTLNHTPSSPLDYVAEIHSRSVTAISYRTMGGGGRLSKLTGCGKN
jgi:hypothetical protein